MFRFNFSCNDIFIDLVYPFKKAHMHKQVVMKHVLKVSFSINVMLFLKLLVILNKYLVLYLNEKKRKRLFFI